MPPGKTDARKPAVAHARKPAGVRLHGGEHHHSGVQRKLYAVLFSSAREASVGGESIAAALQATIDERRPTRDGSAAIKVVGA